VTTGSPGHIFIFLSLCNFYLYFQTLIQEVLFPLMCHSDEDDELWNTDPQEYIRIKYGKHRNNYYYYEKKVKEGWSLIPQPNRTTTSHLKYHVKSRSRLI
jgi:hypothetical protein